MDDLARELLVALGMVAVMVAVHMSGLMGLLHLTGLHLTKLRSPWLKFDQLVVPVGMVTGLFVLHSLEVAAYAVLFLWLNVEPTLEAALYLSAGSYATAGWQGVALPHQWRLLVALESLNGMLLIGWSTAFLFQNLQRIMSNEETYPLEEGAIANESPRDSGSGSGDSDGTNDKDTELMQ